MEHLLWLLGGLHLMDTLSLLSQSLRGAIVAPPGQKLFVADYSSIEARVLQWCAQDEEALNVFREGRCIYMDFAGSIFGYPVTDKKKQAWERQFGKVGILGLGYQCGYDKFVDVAWTLGRIVIPRESDDPKVISSVKVVDAFRKKYWRVKQLWYDQETAAGEAVCAKGETFDCFPCSWWVETYRGNSFLYCRLPSGRRLAYPDPKIKVLPTSWGTEKQSLTYMGVNATTRKWMRQTSYGGLLVENIVQAISRDIMAEAMLRCEESRIYSPILTIHDEIVCVANEHLGDTQEYEHIIAEVPKWASGLPVGVESWKGSRYRK